MCLCLLTNDSELPKTCQSIHSFQAPIKIPTADQEMDDDELAFDFMVTRDLNIGTNFENGTNSLDRRLSYPGRLKNACSEAGLHEMAV